MTSDSLDLQVRRWTAISWVVPTAIALHGAWRRQQEAKGRAVGRPSWDRPWWLFAGLSLAYVGLMIALWRPLPLTLSRSARVGAAIGGGLLSALGLTLTTWGRLALGAMHNLSSPFGAQLYVGHRLVTTGPYALVRHPMYLGGILSGLGAVLTYRTWTMVLVLAQLPLYLVQARREDEALAQEFGEAWEAYRRRVPGWLPRSGPPAGQAEPTAP